VTSTIGDLVDRAAKARRWGDQRVAFEIGVLPSEKVFNATQVKRLRRGERQNLSHELIQRLIDALDLDPAEAWAAAGLLPPGVTADMLRRLDMERAVVGASSDQPDPKSGRLLEWPAPRRSADRRRRDRRHLRLIRAA
jgi:hypothetical protein